MLESEEVYSGNWELFNEYCPILYTDDFVIEFF